MLDMFGHAEIKHVVRRLRSWKNNKHSTNQPIHTYFDYWKLVYVFYHFRRHIETTRIGLVDQLICGLVGSIPKTFSKCFFHERFVELSTLQRHENIF